METLSRIYRENLALATDLYQLTMACGYWRTGTHSREAVFHLFFRQNPFRGGYTVACGLRYAIDFLRHFRFDDSDIAYLGTLTGNDGEPLFEREFLDHLAALEFACDVDAIPEGTVVFPHEPLMRVQGPILQCQLVETILLCILNFQSLIASKAARIASAAGDDPVLEFGLRRAQGLDGALAASWAAHVGGCAATSNVLAGKMFGIPVKGTHAHSWVMSFDTEMEAFRAYAGAMPNNCVFLVDTYDTLTGVGHAIEVGKWLRGQGHRMVGIRLDSGDLARLSIEARKLLDEAGFEDAAIVASNDLNEYLVEELKAQGCRIGVWGIGTKLITGYDQPALGGVYKLAAVRSAGGDWQPRIKLSEQAIKVSNPGIQQVRRFSRDGRFVADVIYETGLGIDDPPAAVNPADGDERFELNSGAEGVDLLEPIFRGGRMVYEIPDMASTREYARRQRDGFQPEVRQLKDPQVHPVCLEEKLHQLKKRLMAEARGVPA